jgi:hypothetical protein
MTTMLDVLRTIIAASPAAASEAMACLRAISVKSTAVQQRYNHVVQIALGDCEATFTAEQRAAMAEYVAIDDDETRQVASVRLSPSERAQIARAAAAAGQNVSEYMRARLLG